MGWDCRTVTINIMVNVHDEAEVNQDILTGTVAREATDAAESVVQRIQERYVNDGVEIEVF